MNEPINENLNLNNQTIINCCEGIEDNDVCTIKILSAYYKKAQILNMSYNRITNLKDGEKNQDAVTLNQTRMVFNGVTNMINESILSPNADINMNKHKISNLQIGDLSNDAGILRQLTAMRII